MTSPACSSNQQGNSEDRPSAQYDSYINSQQSRFQTNTNISALPMEGQQRISSVLEHVATEPTTQPVHGQQSTTFSKQATNVSSQQKQQETTSETLFEHAFTYQHTSTMSCEQITTNPTSWLSQDEDTSSTISYEYSTKNLASPQIQEKDMSSASCEQGINTEGSNLVISNVSSLRKDTYEDNNAVITITPIIIKPESDVEMEDIKTEEYESCGDQVNEGLFNQVSTASDNQEYNTSVNEGLSNQVCTVSDNYKYSNSVNEGLSNQACTVSDNHEYNTAFNEGLSNQACTVSDNYESNTAFNEGLSNQACTVSDNHEYNTSVSQKDASASQQECEANYIRFHIPVSSDPENAAYQENESLDRLSYEASTQQTYNAPIGTDIMSVGQPTECQQKQLMQTECDFVAAECNFVASTCDFVAAECEVVADEQVQQRHFCTDDQMTGVHPTYDNNTALQVENTTDDSFIVTTKDVANQSWSLGDLSGKEVPPQKEVGRNENTHKEARVRKWRKTSYMYYDPHWEEMVRRPSAITISRLPYNCTSRNTSQAKSPSKKSSQDQKYKCQWCLKTFSTRSMYYEHNKSAHTTERSLFRCYVCNKLFTSDYLRQRHYELHNQYYYNACETTIDCESTSADEQNKSSATQNTSYDKQNTSSATVDQQSKSTTITNVTAHRTFQRYMDSKSCTSDLRQKKIYDSHRNKFLTDPHYKKLLQEKIYYNARGSTINSQSASTDQQNTSSASADITKHNIYRCYMCNKEFINDYFRQKHYNIFHNQNNSTPTDQQNKLPAAANQKLLEAQSTHESNCATELVCNDKPPTDATGKINSPTNEIAQNMLSPGTREEQVNIIMQNRKQPITNTTKPQNHLKAHQCKICGQAFAYRSSLERHVGIHSGKKPFLYTKKPRTE